MNEIYITVFYQSKNISIPDNEFENAVGKSLHQAEIDLNSDRREQLRISLTITDLNNTKPLENSILNRIQNSNICVFDETIDPVILFSYIGFCIATGQICILLSNKNSISENDRQLPEVFKIRYELGSLVDKLSYEIYRRSLDIFDARMKVQEKIQAQQRDKIIFKSLWGLEGENRVYIICPEIPPESRLIYANTTTRDYLRLAKFADIDTLFQLKEFLSRYYPEIRIFEATANEIPPDANNENLIVVGGIAWNKYTFQLAKKTNLPLEQRDGGAGNPDPIFDLRTNKSHTTTFGEDGSVQEDIGYFVRIPNPFNRRKTLIMINGVLTYGVLGVARCFTEGQQAVDNCEFLINKIGKSPYFAALIRVPVLNNYATTPDLTKRNALLTLLGYSPERNVFT